MAILKINLLPKRIKQERNRRLMILGGVVIAAVLLTIPAGVLYLRWTVASGLHKQIKLIDAESASYSGIIDKVTMLENREAILAKKLEVLDKLLQRQTTWIRILESLSFAQTRAQDLWLVTISSKSLTIGVDAGKIELAIAGQAFSAASVEDFTRILSKADLSNLEVGQVSMTTSALESQPVLNFTFTVKFKV